VAAESSPLGRLLGDFPSLRTVRDALERAAVTDVPILLLGESGSGRSRVAHAVHETSRRAHRSLIQVDPATLPAELLESELFGYRPGAFTGAAGSQVGRVERAEGGTLVLDQLEELPLASQPKLLRLLAERRYTPLGGQERAADVRFIGIGASDLPQRVEAGVFRRDLYHRIEVMSARIPPLRSRRGELSLLLARMLSDLCARMERPIPEVSERALRWMEDYDWPGNLRELRNVLERALIMEPSEVLDPSPPRGGEPPLALRDVEREAIRRALAWTRGHQGEAAQLLGISRKTLWEKRRRYGLA
jgi:two-component system C4-dicarboxylate transport response regulator DctD